MRRIKLARSCLLGVVVAWSLTGCGGKDSEKGSSKAAATKATPVLIDTPSGVRMAYIPPGTFRMGRDDGADDEKPAREVTITQGFYMDVVEVRQGSFEKFMGLNPSKFVNPDRPVEQVRWREAAEYCNARSVEEGLTPCYNEETWACDYTADGYRLPTEAEWEYASRGGTATVWFYGNRASAGDATVWCKENSNRTTQPDPKRANAWGLCDMLGNLWEWCNDIYDPAAYASGSATDPRGATSGDRKVLRGGAWNMPMAECLHTTRRPDDPANADICAGYDTYGFRAVRKAVTPPTAPK